MIQLTPEQIQQQLTDLNFKAQNIRIVTVSAMENEALEKSTSKEGESFYNSYMNVIFRHGERYVLGYRCEDPLVDHAIIKKGDLYFDPTLQANGDFKSYQFAVLTEFKIFDMMKHAKSNKDFPPDVDFLLTKKKHFKNIINIDK
ncbi:hypothetical protein [Psychromonas ossibalaenae]|uniref:hypothetical protein n=1 Tax=Psychromonas ossibalaenae TaxID=444922 RepID=UPI000361D740|nr:hypothetical protein [Psychromonas ossibalaenae]